MKQLFWGEEKKNFFFCFFSFPLCSAQRATLKNLREFLKQRSLFWTRLPTRLSISTCYPTLTVLLNATNSNWSLFANVSKKLKKCLSPLLSFFSLPALLTGPSTLTQLEPPQHPSPPSSRERGHQSIKQHILMSLCLRYVSLPLTRPAPLRAAPPG